VEVIELKVGDIRKFGYRVQGFIIYELAQVTSTHKVSSGLKVVEAEFRNGTVRKYSRQHLPIE
jgi:hypothetical protein